MNIRDEAARLFLFFTLIFIGTFLFVYLIIHPLFENKLDYIIALKTALSTTLVYLFIVVIKRLTAKKTKEESKVILKGVSHWRRILNQVILYLLIVLTVYSFLI